MRRYRCAEHFVSRDRMGGRVCRMGGVDVCAAPTHERRLDGLLPLNCAKWLCGARVYQGRIYDVGADVQRHQYIHVIRAARMCF